MEHFPVSGNLVFFSSPFITSLLRRLQAQTLPDATPSLGKIPPFTKIAVTFDLMKRLRCPSRVRFSLKISCKHHLQPLGRGSAVKKFQPKDQSMNEWINQLMNHKSFCRAAPGFVLVCLIQIEATIQKFSGTASMSGFLKKLSEIHYKFFLFYNAGDMVNKHIIFSLNLLTRNAGFIRHCN